MVVVPPEESVLFECKFCPTEKDNFYSANLLANVYWIDTRQCGSDIVLPNYVKAPMTVNLRTLGI